MYKVDLDYQKGISVSNLNDTIWSIMNNYLKYPIHPSYAPDISTLFNIFLNDTIIITFDAELNEKTCNNDDKDWIEIVEDYPPEEGYRKWFYKWYFTSTNLTYSAVGGHFETQMYKSEEMNYLSHYEEIISPAKWNYNNPYRVVRAVFEVSVRNNRFYTIQGIMRQSRGIEN